jgi:RecA-family ATPase
MERAVTASRPKLLEPDRGQIDRFFDALFRHRGEEGFVSFRSFYHNNKPLLIEGVPVKSGFKYLCDVAEDHARRAANEIKPAVFCPPIALFNSKDRAREQDLLAGLVLSIECDERPQQAREKLEAILGPATAVLYSGGKWPAPDGEMQDKLHLHWRLTALALGNNLAKLKRARELATRLVGGDVSNIQIAHPLRWPGSWHRKGEPVLCQFATLEPDREIDLDAALYALEAALPADDPKGNGFDYANDDNGDTERTDWVALTQKILAGKNLHDSTLRLAATYVGFGMKPEHALRLLQSLMLASSAPHDERWRARFADLPRLVKDGQAKFGNSEQTAEAEPPSLPFINMSKWDNEPVPEQQWAVPDRIPLGQTTLFTGEGGYGKSTVQLHLCAAHALGLGWLNTLPEPGPSIFFEAEDGEKTIHRRLAAVGTHYSVNFEDMIRGGLHVISLFGCDAVLATPTRSGKIEPTPLYRQLLQAAGDIKPKMIGIASSANVFTGSEIDRTQTQQFIGLLNRMAMLANGAVVLIAHPSLTGINSDTGLSGSTQWHNAVRARFYLKAIKAEADQQPDNDLRELVFKKNQFGPISANIVLRYRNGLFLPEQSASGLDRIAREAKADEIFIDLLERFAGEGRNVSHNESARNYAPATFAKEAEAKKHQLRKADLEAAMRRLFEAKKIRAEDYGRPSQPHSRIIINP